MSPVLDYEKFSNHPVKIHCASLDVQPVTPKSLLVYVALVSDQGK